MNSITKIGKSALLYIVMILLTQNMVAQEFKITKGMCLRYNVTSEGEKYKMYVMVKDVFPQIKFDWIIMKSPCIRGSIAMSSDAWKTADKQNNLFDPGDQKLNDQSCIWVSQYIYSSLKNNGEVKMTPDQVEKHYIRKVYKDYPITLDGKATTIKALYTESDDSTKDKFWINDNKNSPVILKMDFGYSMELYEICSVSQILPVMNIKGNDLPTLIGKSAFDPQIYYLLTQLSEPCAYTVDYKISNGKETVSFHYLGQINGIKMEVVNDTLKSMEIYNNVKGDENGWTRYVGELPGGINFDMKREDIEKILGPPNILVGDVGYTDKNMMLKYNSDDRKKAKLISISFPQK